MIVLDTNVLSEVMKQSPDPTVAHWTMRELSLGLFTTAVSEAEIIYGVRILPEGRRKQALEAAVRAFLPYSPGASFLSIAKLHARSRQLLRTDAASAVPSITLMRKSPLSRVHMACRWQRAIFEISRRLGCKSWIRGGLEPGTNRRTKESDIAELVHMAWPDRCRPASRTGEKVAQRLRLAASARRPGAGRHGGVPLG